MRMSDYLKMSQKIDQFSSGKKTITKVKVTALLGRGIIRSWNK
jgi:hypothetical protein